MLNSESKNRKNWLINHKIWKFILIFTLILGIFFRFAHLDRKVYSADEVRKILWLSGYSSDEFVETLFVGNSITAGQLRNYQHPNADRNLFDALKVLSHKSEHVPLHHILTRYWMYIFPNHPSAKVVSVIISFLAFPALYWLCLELFHSSLTGVVAVALATVNPYYVLTAQNAGSYSLWLVLTFVSSAALLRAMRLGDRFNWLLYALTLALGFYTHFFSVVVALGQGIYVVIVEKFRFKRLIPYLLSGALSVLLFVPWLIATLTNLGRVDEAASYYSQFKIGIKQFIIAYYTNIGKFFIDFYHNKGGIEKILHLLLFVLIVYSIYFLVRQTSLKVWLFVVIMIVLTPILHGVINALSPSAVHIQSRYFLPSFLAIQLSLSFLLASQIDSTKLLLWQKRGWQTIFLLLLFFGIVSNWIIAPSATAAIDDQTSTASGQNVKLSTYINKSENPLVITDASHSFILALLYNVKDNVTFQLLKPNDLDNWKKSLNLKEDHQKFSDIFLIYPKDSLINLIETTPNPPITLKMIDKNLYQVSFN